MNFTKFILIVEYDSTRYHGFQWQNGLPTIQGELERAIGRVCGESSRVIAASRTDAGVHAKGQVVSFWAKTVLTTTTLVKALNYYLPSDIAVKAAYKAVDGFNVRRDALSREYRYYILNNDIRSPFGKGFALFVPQRLDIKAMNKACQLIQGEHDFTSFVTSLDGVRNAVRNVYNAKVDTLAYPLLSRERKVGEDASVLPQGRAVIFYIVANSFLPHQVRNTVGLLLRLGLGKIGIEDFHDIIEAKSLGLAGPTAPAYGLWLTKVNYAKPLAKINQQICLDGRGLKGSPSLHHPLSGEGREGEDL